MATTNKNNDTYKDYQWMESIPAVSFDQDYVLKSVGNGEATYEYKKGSIDQPETVRFASQEVSNVYRGTDIQPSLYAVNKKGKKILTNLRTTYRITDADGNITDYPLSCGVTLQYPVTTGIPELEAEMEQLLMRAIGAIIGFSDADDSTGTSTLVDVDRLSSVLRGAFVNFNDASGIAA